MIFVKLGCCFFIIIEILMEEDRENLEMWKDFYRALNMKKERLTSNLTGWGM